MATTEPNKPYEIGLINVIGQNTKPMNSDSTKGHNTRILYIYVRVVTLPKYIQHALKLTNK